jgi:SAM-dependent methyltransferase
MSALAHKDTAFQPQDCAKMLAVEKTTKLPACIICKGGTVQRFSKPFDQSYVQYCHCSSCGHLTATELDAKPNYASGRYFTEIDTGWEQRNSRMLELIQIISRIPGVAISKRSTILDFGCGSGRLVQDLNRAGFDARGFEPHPETTISLPRVFIDLREIPEIAGRIELITCIEVLEHLREPDETLQAISDLLRPSGYLLVSTDLYNDRTHGEHWYYLNPAAGHVSIFSGKSLTMLLRRHGFHPVLRVNSSVWLFRKAGPIRRSLLERGYFALSQARVRMGLRINYSKRRPSILCTVQENSE